MEENISCTRTEKEGTYTIFWLEVLNSMSTWEITIYYDENTQKYSGDVIRYGNWEDLEIEELEHYINYLKSINLIEK